MNRSRLVGGIRANLWDLFQLIVGSNDQKKAALREQVEYPGRILEIGCATGNVAGAFRDFEYVGIDIDASLVARAEAKFPETNYRFHCCDILVDDFPEPEDFRYVLVSHTAHHLDDDYMKRIIHRCGELLGDAGELVILDMIRPEPEDPFSKQLYYRLDAGEHLRTVPEFVELFADVNEFEPPRLRVLKTRKLAIEVIDGIVITARKRSPTAMARTTEG